MKLISAVQSRFFTPFLLIFVLTACDENVSGESSTEQSSVGNNTSAETEFSVTGVNEFQFLFNDTEEGGIINFRSAEFQQCTLAFIKAKFVEGYETRIADLGKGDIDVTCLTDDDNYLLNDNSETYASMRVNELNEKAIIALSFSLVGFNSERLIVKKDVLLHVDEKQLKTLLSAL